MSRKILDLTGHTYGWLGVESLNGRRNGVTYWNCLCECGEKVVVTSGNLRAKGGHTRSCGCYRIARVLEIHQPGNARADRSRIAGTRVCLLNNTVYKNNSTGYRGVTYVKGKYKATITLRGYTKSLGQFDTLGEAVAARREAERVYFTPLKMEFERILLSGGRKAV